MSHPVGANVFVNSLEYVLTDAFEKGINPSVLPPAMGK